MTDVDKTNNPDEILDVVDEKDAVIGQATREEVSNNHNFIFREVGVLIYDNTGRVYVQQRSRKKSHPLDWIMSVAGHVPAGMSPEAAAHKELKEELGIDTELKFSYKKLDRHFIYLYLGKIPRGAFIKLDLDEAEQGKFVNRRELEIMIKSGEKIEKQSCEDFCKFWDKTLPGLN